MKLGSFQKIAPTLSLPTLLLLAAVVAAENLEIVPPTYGALVVKDQTGAVVHFQVNESVEVIINGMLADTIPRI